MFVSVDSETKWDGERQTILTLSYGREDGTSHTFHGHDAPSLYAQLIADLSKPYTDPDGKTWRQTAVGFHLGHDAAVLVNGLNTDDMELVHRVQAKIKTGLCRADHRRGNRCDARPGPDGRLHAYQSADLYAILTDGMFSDLVAWHRPTGIAMASCPGQGMYLEHRPNGDRYEDWSKLKIRDTGRAFNGTLETVIDEWRPELTDAERAVIAWGKQARTVGFPGATPEQLAAYSEAECVAHARVCRKLIDYIGKAVHVPMKPSDLGGSGSIAAAVNKHYGVTKRTQTHTDTDIDDLAILDYFGGLIEAPVVGLVAGTVEEEDLNSAYPAQMIHMPCMRAGHGRWVTGRDGGIPSAVIGHALVSWAVMPGLTSTPPFIVRDKNGRVCQPLIGEKVWVTLVELQTAVQRFPEAVFVHRSVHWVDDCGCEEPMHFLADLYNSRLAVRAEMALLVKGTAEYEELNAIQRTIKLVINSIYGKFAQTRPEPGPYTNLHYAAYITGATRAQVRRKTWEREDEGATVVYQHTDSVLSVDGSIVDGGNGLGAWGLEKPTEDLLILQPGLATGRIGKTASRGVRKSVFMPAARTWAETVDFTQHPASWPPLITEQQMMISLRLAISRGKPHLAGSFETRVTETQTISRKRDFRRAKQLAGCPTAWAIPPLARAADPVTGIADVKAYQSALDRRRKAGEFDR